jgi:hypothetical protein
VIIRRSGWMLNGLIKPYIIYRIGLRIEHHLNQQHLVKLINKIFPDMVGKEVYATGRYSIYDIENNISIIFNFDINKYINHDYIINIVTIIPGRKGVDVVKILDIQI